MMRDRPTASHDRRPHNHRRRIAMLALTGVLAAAVAVAAAPQPASAKTCSQVSIEARGEQARFMWLAKSKARANWRRKVRATTGLGAPFSNWARADNTEERCLSGPAGTLCIFTGTPCID
ncbi:MAG: hypothetical protein ACRCS9_11855 [Hyphomicrobium sp.]